MASPEELAAKYADRYTIYRELEVGSEHGRWVARPLLAADDSPEKITAGSVDKFAELLQQAAAGRGRRG